MSWLVLICSGSLEAVWAAALAMSNGFRRWRPTVVFFCAGITSLVGLGWAMRSLPPGTAYAVWSGTGAVLTVLWAFLTGTERVTVARVLLLGLLIGSIVGLKAVS